MNVALKEWAVIVKAMMQGNHHLLLRKGGLADKGQTFKIEHPKFFLFPTYEHQKDAMIAPAYQNFYTQTLSLQPSASQLVIESWAEVIKTIQVQDINVLKRLSAWHIWSEDYLKMRLDYKPEKPLYLLILRVFKLCNFYQIENLQRYGGCRSWVPLNQDLNIEESEPVLSDSKFDQTFQSIQQQLSVQ